MSIISWIPTTSLLYVPITLSSLASRPYAANDIIKEDGVPTYVDWAVENDFGVMDINVPLYKKDKGDNVSAPMIATMYRLCADGLIGCSAGKRAAVPDAEA